MRRLSNVLVTGGCGFIGTSFIRSLFSGGFDGRVVNVDKLTYAGNPRNLEDLERTAGAGHYIFVRADICDADAMASVFSAHAIDAVVHFAAESHVDRSIRGPADFIRTNIVGTFTLLEAARSAWGGRDDVLFHHVSTDEVFGSLGPGGRFQETTPYDPRSPYSASKASSDHLVRAAFHTWGLPVTISNCSNNYGPWQYPEKLIPLAILNLLEGKPVPVYGDGRNVRDWLFVEDHAGAIRTILERGAAGRTYAVGGDNEWANIDLVHALCGVVSRVAGIDEGRLRSQVTFVKDRPGHDRRYAIDSARIRAELGWRPRTPFEAGLEATVRWYRENASWVNDVRSGEYLRWIEQHYGASR